jgi:hypothetical protein
MNKYAEREVVAAIKHAKNGGQALHLYKAIPLSKIPNCFKKTDEWGHLIDKDKVRLIETAKRLGVIKIKVDGEDTRTQHINLCGKPLQEAIKESVLIAECLKA